jgi:uncharacterized membrane protein
MDDFFILLYVVFLLVILGCVFVLPITALIITLVTRKRFNQRIAELEKQRGGIPQAQLIEKIRQLRTRIEQLERNQSTSSLPQPEVVPEVAPEPQPEPPPPPPINRPPRPPIEVPTPAPFSNYKAADLESLIGRRWIGWVAVLLILFATGFFLKYAFDNRWIGEVGRVAVGIFAGSLMTVLGYRYFRRGWKVFSQILTAGGVVLLYLSAYAAFGYYHLVPQKAAFAFVAILIAEAAVLALLYEAPAIAIMALIGGFITPLLLHSDRDQHLSLFGYIVALDVGALAVLKHWRGLRTIAFLGSHILFWLWYDEHYHEQRLVAVLLFQTAVFGIFLAAHLVARLLRRVNSLNTEDLWLLGINPFVFFATTYHLLNPLYHDWMGVFAIVMALVYAGTAKLLLDRTAWHRVELLTLIGIALTFVTLAIPIQLRSNWITIAWSVEALMMLWAGIETRALRIRIGAGILFGLALIKLIFWDTPYGNRGAFIPVFNRYFLSSLAVVGCLFTAVALYQKIGKQKNISPNGFKVALLLAAVVSLWLVCSIETHTFFVARSLAARLLEDADHQRWLGQMALSVVWATYAAVLAAIGFVRRSSAIRWASLSLFALTVVKAMLVDIAQLQQLYRIIVFFVLGVLLLLVAWAYHKAFQARESSA